VINLATNPTESIHTCCRVFANVKKVAQHPGHSSPSWEMMSTPPPSQEQFSNPRHFDQPENVVSVFLALHSSTFDHNSSKGPTCDSSEP
jgi:hypothetical protein